MNNFRFSWLQTPFVRQNTPHPKELKAKAHKLFAKGSKQGSMEDSDIDKSQATSIKSPDGEVAGDPSGKEDRETLKEVHCVYY